MSKKLNTTEVPDPGNSGVKKVITPGNVVVKINDVTFDKTPFDDESWNIHIHVETKPMGEDFEGFLISKDDTEGKRYLGQVGRIRASEYTFKDSIIKSGTKATSISRDSEVLKFMKAFCKNIGALDWFIGQSDIHDTMEEFMTQFQKDAPFKNKWYETCLAGKGYNNKDNFLNYDLFFPRFTKDKTPIEIVDTEPSALITFNSEIHIKMPKTKKVAAEKDEDFDLL